MERSEKILRFWFGGLDPEGPLPRERLDLWFGGAAETDRLIRARFGEDVERAAAGEYLHWEQTPRCSLALILLLDQFTRNIHRDTPLAYASDGVARRICLQGLERGWDRELAWVERAFYYLPLEHAEESALQERSVALFRALAAEAPPLLREPAASFLDYAERHREVIARFGRFPHRNKTLGRPSSPEEEEFLRRPGSSF